MTSLLEFHRELDRWAEAGKTARFWWRDDDAIAATPALDRLIAETEAVEAPLGLAVIPALEEPSLAARLQSAPHVAVLQHGFRHINHAPVGEKKAEFGDHRTEDRMFHEMLVGCGALDDRYGARFTRIFVPPWNRIFDQPELSLPLTGLKRISTFKPRHSQSLAMALRPINTHVDPIFWKKDKGFLGNEAAFAQVIGHLQARRLAEDVNVDPSEPTGLLSHHLVQDDATWDFLRKVGQVIARHPAAEWADPIDLAKDPR